MPPLDFALGHVFQRTMSFSLPPSLLLLLLLVLGDVEEKAEAGPPFLTIRSERMISFTFPRTGTRPHATGEVHSAAVYAILPVTVGRCGCVEGNNCSVMCGERISCGRGFVRSEGRRSWRMRIAKRSHNQ